MHHMTTLKLGIATLGFDIAKTVPAPHYSASSIKIKLDSTGYGPRCYTKIPKVLSSNFLLDALDRHVKALADLKYAC